FKIYYNPLENDSLRLFERLYVNSSFFYSSLPEFSSLYQDFFSLSYKKKMSLQGLNYLFAAWSHDVSNKVVLSSIIKFLQNTHSVLHQLKNIYEYAFKKYGHDFDPTLSPSLRSIAATPEEKRKEPVQEPETFSSPDERAQYFLKKSEEGEEEEE